MSLAYDSLFIGGEWVQPAEATSITVVSTSTEEVLGQVPEATRTEVDAARNAFDDPAGWSQWEPVRRAEALARLAVAGRRVQLPSALRDGPRAGSPIQLHHAWNHLGTIIRPLGMEITTHIEHHFDSRYKCHELKPRPDGRCGRSTLTPTAGPPPSKVRGRGRRRRKRQTDPSSTGPQHR